MSINSRSILVISWLVLCTLQGAEPGRTSSHVFPFSQRIPVLLPLDRTPVPELIRFMPEDTLINLALCASDNDLLKLDAAKADELIALFTDTYDAIGVDPACRGLPSVTHRLVERQTMGHTFLYEPPGKARGTVLFLHGWGGNWHLYLWALKQALPEYAIVAPTWGISWYDGPEAYLDAMWSHLQKVAPEVSQTSWLMALSAGGPGGFRLYNRSPQRYHGYVCLASMPTLNSLEELDRDLKILMINGTQDTRFPIGRVRHRAHYLARRLPGFSLQEIDSDHFFLLSRLPSLTATLRDYISENEASP